MSDYLKAVNRLWAQFYGLWSCPCGGRTPPDELNCNQCGEPNPESKVSTIPSYEPPEPPKEETWRDRPPLL